MRTRVLLLSAMLMLGLAPAGAAAASERCSIEVAPATGAPTDTYRLTATGFPVDPQGGSVEVRIDVRRLGTREGMVFFLHLVPGTTSFYLDINQLAPEEPVDPMTFGRYQVVAETPHRAACHDTARFEVAG